MSLSMYSWGPRPSFLNFPILPESPSSSRKPAPILRASRCLSLLSQPGLSGPLSYFFFYLEGHCSGDGKLPRASSQHPSPPQAHVQARCSEDRAEYMYGVKRFWPSARSRFLFSLEDSAGKGPGLESGEWEYRALFPTNTVTISESLSLGHIQFAPC